MTRVRDYLEQRAVATSTPETEVPDSGSTKKELLEVAQSRNVPVPPKATKSDILELLDDS